ncbi:hypothetical protein JW992_14255, partial [candidate division KSB1 bacterium]|nr:hypothetical protein [candidate division KSB1 bacterium]
MLALLWLPTAAAHDFPNRDKAVCAVRDSIAGSLQICLLEKLLVKLGFNLAIVCTRIPQRTGWNARSKTAVLSVMPPLLFHSVKAKE